MANSPFISSGILSGSESGNRPAASVVPRPRGLIAAASLSAQLRTRTASLHRQTEILLGLPSAINTLDDYRGCLSRFFGLYDPLDRSLARFSEWADYGVVLPSPGQSSCLAADLAAIGVAPAGVTRTPPALLPSLPTFAHALGALYVLEGSTLGGLVILRDVEARLGCEIAGATAFFGGRGTNVGPTWLRFKTALDAFGRKRPRQEADAISGAEAVFRAIMAWFAPVPRPRLGSL
jgi:heme oxygenase